MFDMESREYHRKENLMPNGVPKYIRCYDNGGKTIDRYTVVFTGRYAHKTNRTFWYLAMNSAPYQGFGQHGETNDRPCDRPYYSHLGKKITFDKLPTDCQKLVIETYTYLWDIVEPELVS